jgi:hypothetical protein
MTEMKPNLNHDAERLPESERVPESEQMKVLLKAALPRIAEDLRPARDLWPDVLRKMDLEPVRIPWFDWALAGGLVALAVAFPTAIPVLLYYL